MTQYEITLAHAQAQNLVISGFVLCFFVQFVFYVVAEKLEEILYLRKKATWAMLTYRVLATLSFLPGYIVAYLNWGEPLGFGALVGALGFTAIIGIHIKTFRLS